MNNPDNEAARLNDLVKKLRSGVTVNRSIETLGGMQHYVSNLEAADKIESLTAQNEAYDNALRRLGSQEAWTGRDVRDSAWGVGERNAIIKYAIQERQRIKQQGEDDD